MVFLSATVSQLTDTRPVTQRSRPSLVTGMASRVELSLGVIGPGLVGKALIQQLQKQAGPLEQCGASLRVAGISNSRKMLLTDPGSSIELEEWQEQLSEGTATDLNYLQQRLAAHQNPVVVDCTASGAVPALYARWLNYGHVVTPNKRLGSGAQQAYNEVIQACNKNGTKFFYEATVGAGLPIISSLQGLLRTGDEVQSIEGVFSGTLSYIFNTFGPGRSFSSVVAGAKSLGYTEPDPRDDLSGVDVARKVVILARECGLQLELEDVDVQSLVPEPLREASSADEFLEALPQFDQGIADEAAKAASRGEKLCYVGQVDVIRRKCSVALRPYPKEHAFAQLSGSDNIIAFKSERYNAQPLIVRGPWSRSRSHSSWHLQ